MSEPVGDLRATKRGDWAEPAWQLIMAGWVEHRMILLIVAASTIGLMIVDFGGLAPGTVPPFLDIPTALLAEVLALDMAVIAVFAYRARHRVSWAEARTALRPTLLSLERLLGLALIPLVMRWLMLAAVGWKASIPMLHPFRFDVSLARLDAQLTGRAAWEWFGPLTRSAWAMQFLDVSYYVWFVVLGFVMLAVAWAPYGHDRRRFLVAMALLWTLGSLVGVLMSSAGPIYFSRVTGIVSGFDTLASRVAKQAPIAAAMQATLWRYYNHSSGQLVAGISAFPSLHVAVPALFAFAAPRRWRLAAILLTGLTWLGSVVLGWHYLVDGAGGIALAGACWLLAARLATAEDSASVGR